MEKKNTKSLGQIISNFSMPILLGLLVLVFSVLSDRFFTPLNLTNILVQNVHIAVCATGVFMIMVSGGCDLSIGYQMSVAAVLVAKLLSNGVVSVPVAIVLGIGICVALGFFNGIMSITLNSQNTGPILRHAITGKTPAFLVIDLVYSGTGENYPGPQQQTLVTLNGADGKGILWGLRFGRNSVRFLDEKPVTFSLPEDGKVTVRILIDTVSQYAEVYINGGKTPVLRCKALKLKAPASEPSVSIGDGSVAVKGICELYQMNVKLY